MQGRESVRATERASLFSPWGFLAVLPCFSRFWQRVRLLSDSVQTVGMVAGHFLRRVFFRLNLHSFRVYCYVVTKRAVSESAVHQLSVGVGADVVGRDSVDF